MESLGNIISALTGTYYILSLRTNILLMFSTDIYYEDLTIQIILKFSKIMSAQKCF